MFFIIIKRANILNIKFLSTKKPINIKFKNKKKIIKKYILTVILNYSITKSVQITGGKL